MLSYTGTKGACHAWRDAYAFAAITLAGCKRVGGVEPVQLSMPSIAAIIEIAIEESL